MDRNDKTKNEIISLMNRLDLLLESGASCDDEQILALSQELDRLIVLWVKGTDVFSVKLNAEEE